MQFHFANVVVLFCLFFFCLAIIFLRARASIAAIARISYASAHVCLSVCPSVRPGVTSHDPVPFQDQVR